MDHGGVDAGAEALHLRKISETGLGVKGEPIYIVYIYIYLYLYICISMYIYLHLSLSLSFSLSLSLSLYIYIHIILHLDHGGVDACAEALHLGQREVAVGRRLTSLDTEVGLDRVPARKEFRGKI